MKYKLLAAGAHRAIQVTDEILVTTRKFVEVADADLEKVQNAVDAFGYKLLSEEEADQPEASDASADNSAEASGGTTATPNPSAANASASTSKASSAPEGGK